MPISGRAGAVPALEPQEAYPPARSTALAGYVTRPDGRRACPSDIARQPPFHFQNRRIAGPRSF